MPFGIRIAKLVSCLFGDISHFKKLSQNLYNYQNPQVFMREDTLSFPNILTLLRFLLSTLMFFFLLRKETLLAMMIFIVVAISDLADGWFARSMKLTSSFGEMLDPMADKFMVFLALIALLMKYNYPIYGILIITRDIISLLGSLLIFLMHKKNWRPNKLGKVTTLLQVITIISFLLNLRVKLLILDITIILSILAGLIYLFRMVELRNIKES